MSLAGMGCGGIGGMGGMGGIGMDYSKGGKGKGQDGYAATQSNIDMLSNAVSQLPPSLASDRSQALQFTCQAEFVSALIGKAGQGTKQIAIMTDTKIMIREIDGNSTEKTVVVKGNAINDASVPWIEGAIRNETQCVCMCLHCHAVQEYECGPEGLKKGGSMSYACFPARIDSTCLAFSHCPFSTKQIIIKTRQSSKLINYE